MAVLNPISRIDPPLASLSAATGTGAGSVLSLSRPRKNLSMQVVFTSNPSPVKVALEGSIDGTDWFSLVTFDTGGGAASKDIVASDNISVLYARANLVTLTGGTSPTVTATVLAE